MSGLKKEALIVTFFLLIIKNKDVLNAYTQMHREITSTIEREKILSLEAGLIRNGCGGTRAAYGTAVILRTTVALLDTIRDIVDQRITNSTLIDIAPDRISISDTEFPMEACNCCGNKE